MVNASMNTVLWWFVCAVIMFWSLGAYNRLVRLRAKVTHSLLSLGVHWRAQVNSIHTHALSLGRVAQESQWGALEPESPLRAVLAAAKQLNACLAPVIDTPRVAVSVDQITTVRTAQEVLQGAWSRLADVDDDLVGSSVPQMLTQQWQQHDLLAQAQREVFNAQVQRYNKAITQFPASIMARAFGFEASVAI
jgi:LemA protein